MSTFVALGNPHQPFTRLLQYIETHAEQFPGPVIAQTGHTPFKSDKITCVDFVEMSEFERLIQTAELVILQAGGGGVLLAVNAGKVPVVVPRRSALGEHIDDHQIENGLELAASGKVMYAANPEDIPAAMVRALEKQKNGRDNDTVPLVREISRLLANHASLHKQITE